MPSTPEDTLLYIIKTYTGNTFMAGTDSNVFLKLYGSDGDSSEFRLHNENTWDEFDGGKVDVFRVRCKNIGMIHRLSVRHDSTGRWSSWFLSKITVLEEGTQRETTFPCNRWLSQESHDSRTTLYLDSDVVPVTYLDPLHSQNRPSHHSEKYQSDALIIRRGQSFNLDLHLARPYNAKKDFFFLILVSGLRPRQQNKTFVFIPKVEDFDSFNQEWGYKVTRSVGRVLSIEVNCPADALVAKYRLIVETDTRTVMEHSEPLYILFNPWSKDDEVYMQDEACLREYIMSQHGTVYVGSKNSITPRNWYFGQFEQISLECIFELLNETGAARRGTAADVARLMSARMNSNDNNGVLVGNWTGNYHDGKEPTFWTSTPPIFEEYMSSSTKNPVRYGQCWVFSAILTTALRTLGIPARCVTNFNSAHDTNKNASFDVYLDEDGSVMDDAGKDSIWNFHCWNDAWMARPDLPPGYGGWQAVDATPQELSKGIFQTGPASHRAIKEGRIDIAHDTQFILAEVNSDVMIWQRNNSTKQWEMVNSKRDHIGKNISTKGVGTQQREDITASYKFPEGSVLERASVRNALRLSGNQTVRTMPRDLEMKVVPQKSAIMIGEQIVLSIDLKNTSSKVLTVKVIVGGHVVRYNGVAKGKIDRLTDTIDVKPNANQVAVLKIDPRHYIAYLNEMTMVRFFVSSTVIETGQICLTEKLIDIQKPELTFENMPSVARHEQEMDFQVAFENPLTSELTGCQIHFDGTMMKERISIKNGIIPPKQKFKIPVKLIPNARKGRKSLLVTFNSKELVGLHAFTKIHVK